MKAKVMHEGREIEIEFSKETIEALVEATKKPPTGWETPQIWHAGFIISDKGLVYEYIKGSPGNADNTNNLNEFSTVEKAQEIADKQLLFRKLQKYSDEHDGDKIDWHNINKAKYSIFYSYMNLGLFVRSKYNAKGMGEVFFYTERIAKDAIKEFKKELEEYYSKY